MYTTINRQSDMNYADLLDRSPVPFHLLVKPVGSSCNLACQYCYYPQKDHTSGRMTDDVLKKFIEFYIRAQPKTAKEINFVSIFTGFNFLFLTSFSTVFFKRVFITGFII